MSFYDLWRPHDRDLEQYPDKDLVDASVDKTCTALRYLPHFIQLSVGSFAIQWLMGEESPQMAKAGLEGRNGFVEFSGCTLEDCLRLDMAAKGSLYGWTDTE